MKRWIIIGAIVLVLISLAVYFLQQRAAKAKEEANRAAVSHINAASHAQLAAMASNFLGIPLAQVQGMSMNSLRELLMQDKPLERLRNELAGNA